MLVWYSTYPTAGAAAGTSRRLHAEPTDCAAGAWAPRCRDFAAWKDSGRFYFGPSLSLVRPEW